MSLFRLLRRRVCSPILVDPANYGYDEPPTPLNFEDFVDPLALGKLNRDLGIITVFPRVISASELTTLRPQFVTAAEEFNLSISPRITSFITSEVAALTGEQTLLHPVEEVISPFLYAYSARHDHEDQDQQEDALSSASLEQDKTYYGWEVSVDSGRIADLIKAILIISNNEKCGMYGTYYEAKTGLRYWEVYTDGTSGLFQEWIELFTSTEYLKLAPLEIQEFYNALTEKEKLMQASLLGLKERIYLGRRIVPNKRNPRSFWRINLEGTSFVPPVLAPVLHVKRKVPSEEENEDDFGNQNNVKRRAVSAHPSARPRNSTHFQEHPNVPSTLPRVVSRQSAASSQSVTSPAQSTTDLALPSRRSTRQAARQATLPAIHPGPQASRLPRAALYTQNLQPPSVLAPYHQVIMAPPRTLAARHNHQSAHALTPGGINSNQTPVTQVHPALVPPPLNIPFTPTYGPTRKLNGAGKQLYPWNLARQQMWLAKHPGAQLPVEATISTYNPAHLGTPECVDVRLLLNTPVTAIEIIMVRVSSAIANPKD